MMWTVMKTPWSRFRVLPYSVIDYDDYNYDDGEDDDQMFDQLGLACDVVDSDTEIAADMLDIADVDCKSFDSSYYYYYYWDYWECRFGVVDKIDDSASAEFVIEN